MKTKTVTVKYHNMFGKERGERSYEIVIPDQQDTTENLETVFRYMHMEDQLKKFHERSMSVGDSVVIDGEEWRCEYIGWKKISEAAVGEEMC